MDAKFRLASYIYVKRFAKTVETYAHSSTLRSELNVDGSISKSCSNEIAWPRAPTSLLVESVSETLANGIGRPRPPRAGAGEDAVLLADLRNL